jgi:uncharacterized glyoxalase superfamily protein PhnB
MQSIFPVLKYDDARAAIEFLEAAFGFGATPCTTARTAESRTRSSGTATST